MLGGKPQHRRLLRDLAAPAIGRDAGVALQAVELAARLGLDLAAQLGVGHRIVHVGEHEVLEDEDAELIA